MRLHLCGVRGSLPAPGDEYRRVGGQTSCIAISHDDALPSLVLDAGTGLRNVSALLGGAPFRGAIVLGHLHWDHTMGLPFFTSGDHPEADVRLLVPEQGEGALELLERTMSPPTFPITPRGLRGSWSFETYEEGTHELGGFTVLAREIPHGGGRTMGLRVSDGTHAIAYLSDHAPHLLGAGPSGIGEPHPAAVELVEGVDVLLHDAQYTRDELAVKWSWGHAAMEYPVLLGERCGVGTVLLFHHDPRRTDDEVEALAADVAEGARVRVGIAREGMTVDL